MKLVERVQNNKVLVMRRITIMSSCPRDKSRCQEANVQMAYGVYFL